MQRHHIHARSDLLLLCHVNLEADNIAVLDLTLRESELRLHELNHARFDFLQLISMLGR